MRSDFQFSTVKNSLDPLTSFEDDEKVVRPE